MATVTRRQDGGGTLSVSGACLIVLLARCELVAAEESAKADFVSSARMTLGAVSTARRCASCRLRQFIVQLLAQAHRIREVFELGMRVVDAPIELSLFEMRKLKRLGSLGNA